MGAGCGESKLALHIPSQVVLLSKSRYFRRSACVFPNNSVSALCIRRVLDVLADEAVRRGADEVDGEHACTDRGGDGGAHLVEDVDVLAVALEVRPRAEPERRRGAGAVHGDGDSDSDQPEELAEVLHVRFVSETVGLDIYCYCVWAV